MCVRYVIEASRRNCLQGNVYIDPPTIRETIEQSTTDNSLSTVQIIDNDTINTITTDFDASSTPPTVTEIEESNTSVQPGPEFDTIASTYYITESTTESNTISTDNNVTYETSFNPEEVYTTPNILVQSISPSINENTEINNNETNFDTVDSSERKFTNQRRKKVILRRRPVTVNNNNNGNTSSTASIQIEDNKKYQANRRRKVLKRIRLLNGKSSTISFENSSSSSSSSSTSQEEELSSSYSEASSETNIFQSDNTTDPISTEFQSEEILESDNVTENLSSTFPTEFSNVIDYTLTEQSSDSNLETSTMTTESTKDDHFISNSTTIQSTVMDETITDTLTSTTESTFPENDDIYSTVITTEATVTPPSTYVDNTFDPEETRLATENVTVAVQTTTTTPSFSRNLDESQVYSRSSSSETRYVRKKFLRKRPVLLPETPNSRYALISRPHNRTLSTTERNEIDVNQLSKRRKSLFVRRRPVSSTTRTTEGLEVNNEDINETEEEEEQQEDDDVDDTTTKDIISSASVENESLEFWKHYTIPADKLANQRPSPPTSDQIRNTYLTTEPSITTYPTVIKEPEELEKDDSKISGNVNKFRYVTINRRPESRRVYKVPSSIKNLDNVNEENLSTTERIFSSTKRWYPIDDSSPEETEDNPETKEAARLRFNGYRQARARYRNYEDKLQKDRINKETETTPSYFEYSTSSLRSRYQTKRPITPVEVPVTETLIPAKKFDYAADAFHRKQQSLRTTTPQHRDNEEEEYTTKYKNEDNSEIQNFVVDSEGTTTPSSNKPLVTRLVTSIAESGTTERQKILIKTKYSSLTSTTRIPVQNVINRNVDYPSTTQSFKMFNVDQTNEQTVTTLDDSINEIRPAIEASTLPIESEFLYRGNGRFTTESHESSTIPIESVFSNLIAGPKEH